MKSATESRGNPAGSQAAAIAERRAAIEARIAAACARTGRDPATVAIVGVTKTQPASTVLAAAEAGITDVGENYVQELTAKYAEVGTRVRWHFIGHLQRNKISDVAPLVAMIHSVDSDRLAAAIDHEARALGRSIPVLMQVNTSGEASKFGIAPEAAPQLAATIAGFGNLRFEGLMTIAAFLDDPEALRPMFALLRTMRGEIAGRLGIPLPHLSMGMTGDFEVAIEEGATMIRIGTALFGARG